MASKDRLDLHVIDFREGDAAAHPPVAQHGVVFIEHPDPAQHLFFLRQEFLIQALGLELAELPGHRLNGGHVLVKLWIQHGHGAGHLLQGVDDVAELFKPADFVDELFDAGQELVEGRVQQADGDGQPVHGPEDLHEVLALHGHELVGPVFPLLRGVGQDHVAHQGQTFRLVEHALGAAQPDALGAVVPWPCWPCPGCRRWPRPRFWHTCRPTPSGLPGPWGVPGPAWAPHPGRTEPVVPSMVTISPSLMTTPPTRASFSS